MVQFLLNKGLHAFHLFPTQRCGTFTENQATQPHCTEQAKLRNKWVFHQAKEESSAFKCWESKDGLEESRKQT